MSRQVWTVAVGLSLLVCGSTAAPAQEGEGVVTSCTPLGPPAVAWWAAPSRTAAYQGGWVGGGGNLGHGEPRALNEGAWGWDYLGCLGIRQIWLGWNHGKRYQGGQGAYRVDGHPVKNILVNPPPPGNEH